MVMIHRKKSDNYDRSIGQTGNDTLSWVQTDETFSGVITYRVSQTNRLVIMTTNRRAGNPGTPDGGYKSNM